MLVIYVGLDFIGVYIDNGWIIVVLMDFFFFFLLSVNDELCGWYIYMLYSNWLFLNLFLSLGYYKEVEIVFVEV